MEFLNSKECRRDMLLGLKDETIAVLCDTDPDGYGAAWAVSKFLTNCKFFPIEDGRPDWEMAVKNNPEILNCNHIMMLDMSFDRSTTLSLYQKYNTVTVIDHHWTAKSEIGDLHGVFINEHKSAAALAYEFFDSSHLPNVIKYIQDYDLWQHRLPHTHEIASLLQSLKIPIFDSLDELDFMLSTTEGIDNAATIGGSALNYRRAMSALAEKNVMRGTLNGYNVPFVNISNPLLVSDVGDTLSDGEPFSLSWFQQSDGTYKYSLRSRFNKQQQAIDVSVIAKFHGGGGHSTAASFITNDRIV